MVLPHASPCSCITGALCGELLTHEPRARYAAAALRRDRLFELINDLPTCYEIVSGKAPANSGKNPRKRPAPPPARPTAAGRQPKPVRPPAAPSTASASDLFLCSEAWLRAAVAAAVACDIYTSVAKLHTSWSPASPAGSQCACDNPERSRFCAVGAAAKRAG